MTDAHDLSGATRASTISGIRWVLWLNAVTLPLSFATSLILGRVSASVLGLYAATQIFVGTFQVAIMFGGNAVFTRFVPGLPHERRLSFLLSYASLVMGGFTVVATAMILVAPDLLRATLARFGAPPVGLALAIGAATVVWAFACHYLYAIGRAAPATIALKSIVVGYFAFALWWYLAPAEGDAGAFDLWAATAAIYAAGAAFAAMAVGRAVARTGPPHVRWFLPAGFWGAAFYTHAGKLVEFVYTSLSPSLVLLWLDVESLGWLTAALRWVTILTTLPAMLVPAVAPGLARLDAAGMREVAVRQAHASIRAVELLVVPSVLGLVLFAPWLMGLFGAEYARHAGLLRVLALSALPTPLVYLGSGLIVAFGAIRGYVVVSIVYVAASLAASFALIPAFGLSGAAWAAAASATVQAAVVALVARPLGLRPGRSTVLGLAAGAAAAAAAFWTDAAWPLAAAAWASTTALFAAGAGLSVAEMRLLTARFVARRS